MLYYRAYLETMAESDRKKQITVRRATRDDIPMINKFIHELADYENMPDDPKLTHEDLIRDGFDSPRKWFFCLMAEIGDETVGFAMCTWGYSSRTGREIYLENLLVRPSWRNAGVGKRLFQEIAKVAISEGAQSIDGQVMYDKPRGQQFYASFGARNVRDTEKLEPFKISRYHLEKLAEDCNYVAESYKLKKLSHL